MPNEIHSGVLTEVDVSSADGSPVRGEGPIFSVRELGGLRASVEDWVVKATDALWGFRRTEGYEAGSFWKDSRPLSRPNAQPPNVTTTARACIGFLSAERMAKLGFKESWEEALKDFSSHTRVFQCNDKFYEAQPRVPRAERGQTPLPEYEEQNNFDIAHLADFILADDYVARFEEASRDWTAKSLFGARELREGEPKPKPSGRKPEKLAKLENAAEAIAVRLQKALQDSIRIGGRTGAAPNSTLALRGEVRFEPDNEDSAHYFVTLHALRALHMLRAPLSDENLRNVVAGAKQFALEQCYYYQRGTTQKQDPLRLAFSGCIYILYEEHVDKDLCLAIIETLQQAQQSNGSWPATHPVIREKDRAPWHISSHEVALCLTWLYFQPRVPDAGRPRLIAMMKRYFDRAIAAAYHPGAGAAPPVPKGKQPTVRPELARGWQDDHTRSEHITVGWANAAVCHFLGNFVSILDDWINRCVIDELGLSFATHHYLIDDSVGKPSLRWRRDLAAQRAELECPSSPAPPNSGPGHAHSTPSAAATEIWPDIPPHAWRPQIASDDLASILRGHWTDPTPGAILTDRLATQVLKPLIDDPREQPKRNMCSGLLPGEPGTRKTTLVKRIATVLEWPMVAVPASLIFDKGFEALEAQATAVFWRLNQLRRCVIFFDEFEEFFLDRQPPRGGIRYESRTIAAFTTSAMLPRLQELHDVGRCLVFFATNHEDKLDPAIKRKGRMDFKATVGYPSLERLADHVEELSRPARDGLGLLQIKDHGEAELRDAVARELRRLSRSLKRVPQRLTGKEVLSRFGTVEEVLKQAVRDRLKGAAANGTLRTLSTPETVAWAEKHAGGLKESHRRNVSSAQEDLSVS